MAEDNFALTTFYTSWKAYQDHLKAALALLTDEQLDLRVAPRLRSIGENVLHIIGCRMFWFTEFLGEDGSAELQAYARWNEVALRAPYVRWHDVAPALGSPAPTSSDLAEGLDRTWRFMAACLAHWPAGAMQQSFAEDQHGQHVEVSRAQVVWHVLEHDLHHGGEVSLTLGLYGLQAEFPTVLIAD
ncbi:MAG TPA: DinB family protein [Ktedonobacterales bacterium]|nr:DinB family protein [Ktedonobacterales bacterium]